MLKQITYQFFMRHTYSPIYFHMILKKSGTLRNHKLLQVKKYPLLKENML